jgi:hypothetical protein
MEPRDAQALHELVDLLDEAGIRYSIGGSVAASYVGEPRSTMDVDMLIDLRPERVETLAAALSSDFHVDEASIRDAVTRCSAFQALHLGTYTKFDLFVSGASELDITEMATRVLRPLGDETDREVHVASAEVIVLRKLDWFRRGDCISDRQWNDVLGVLKRQGQALDLAGMRSLAERLGLTALLDRALDEAGWGT